MNFLLKCSHSDLELFFTSRLLKVLYALAHTRDAAHLKLGVFLVALGHRLVHTDNLLAKLARPEVALEFLVDRGSLDDVLA